MAAHDFVFQKTSSVEIRIADGTCDIYVPNSLAGNCLLLFIQSGTVPTADPTAVDNTGAGANPWAVAKGVVGNQRLTALVLTNCNAGVNKITVTLQTADTFVSYVYAERSGISQAALASALDGTPTGATMVAGSPVAAGSLTTTVANSVVFQYGSCDGTLADALFTEGSGFTPLGVQRSSQNGQANPFFAQFQIKASPGAINPTYTYTGGGGTPQSDTLAFALKFADVGTPPPAGFRLGWALGCNVAINQTAVTLDFAHNGNLIHISTAGSDFAVSTIIDGDSNNYPQGDHFLVPTLAFHIEAWNAKNVTPNPRLRGIVITWAGSTVQAGFVGLLGFVGAHATNPKVAASLTNSGNQTVAANLDMISVTAIPGEIVVMNGVVESHTVSAMVAPTPANGGCANIAVFPTADGAATTMDEDDLRAFWYVNTPAAQMFTVSIQHNTAGVNHWGAIATRYQAAAGGGSSLEESEYHAMEPQTNPLVISTW